MALKRRVELEQLTDQNLPTNNSKQISAEKHREVVDALTESQYNILDDQLKDLKYDADNTLAEFLANIFRNTIKRPSFSGYDINGNPVGYIFTIDDAANSIIQEARVTAVGEVGDRIRITFKESIEGKVIIPVLHGTNNSNYHQDYDSGPPVIYYISSTVIDLAIRELEGIAQNLKIEFVII